MKKRLAQGLITCIVMSSLVVTPVVATPQDDVKSLENQKKEAEAQAASVNSQLVDLLVEFNALKSDIDTQEKRIETAEKDLKKAEEKEKQQYEDMKLRIKYMYEEGDASFVETLVTSKSYTDLVNKAEYVQKVHDYDRDMLDEYVKTKNEVKDLKSNLEEGQAEMEFMAEEMGRQKTTLESTLTEMQSQISDFDSQLAQAKEEAAAELERIEQENQEISTGTEEENNTSKPSNGGNNSSESKPNKPSNGGNSSSESKPNKPSKPSDDGNDSSSSKPSNTSLGQQIANKGCQYIGNPYEFGGNSLTNGIDCSGFVQQIHKKFGISTPRSSSGLRSGGKSVAYADKLPGDVICYSGHVAIYIGNNTVVHASNSKPYPAGGIKTTSPANYRSVLAVRRYW